MVRGRLRNRHRRLVRARPAARLGGVPVRLGGARSGGFFDAGRAGRAGARLVGLAMMLGCALAWARSAWVAAPRLERPLVTQFRAKVERIETRVAKKDLRLTLAPA